MHINELDEKIDKLTALEMCIFIIIVFCEELKIDVRLAAGEVWKIVVWSNEIYGSGKFYYLDLAPPYWL